jgi:hypothetical protein
LRNKNCPYCGRPVDTIEHNEDHVIARGFVPKGKLEGEWNLIVQTCELCNTNKSKLEDDLSSISMQPDAFGRYAADDEQLAAESLRKGRSVSRRTRKAVEKSIEKIRLKVEVSPIVEIQFGMTSPPQILPDRAYELARLHVSAFFYWVTFQPETGRGGFWPGSFFPVVNSPRSDWGNSLMRGFMDAVVTWQPRVLGTTAGGFFKVAIRRHPQAECWSWALEWNKNYRLAGFFGDQSAAESMVAKFSRPEMQTIKEQPGQTIRFRYREEIALTDDEDKIFRWTGNPGKSGDWNV